MVQKILMERPEDIQERGMREPLILGDQSKGKGGLRTLPFILANEGFERAASNGLEPNMIMYLMGGYGLEMATGSNIIFLWSAATNFTPILSAFLADSYTGRFRMIGYGSIFSLMGMALLLSTTMIPGARPCLDTLPTKTCTSPTPIQLLVLCASFGLMAIGAGGIRSSTMAFGADQLVTSNDTESLAQDRDGQLDRFFSWFYLSISFSVLFALTCIVYIQDHLGWKAGFGVPVFLMLLSAMSFFSASSFYVKVKPKSSLFVGFAQVIVASWRNRQYKISSQHSSDRVYHVAKGSSVVSPSEKLRFLNKACIVKDPGVDLTLEGTATNPWCLCTVDQVEEAKSVIKIIPLWSTSILLGVNDNQHSARVLQANAMHRHVFSTSFEIPAGSFGTFALITVILWLVLYDRVIIPVTSKITKKPFRLDVKTRMGIGLFLSFVSMTVAGFVESYRRDIASRSQGGLFSGSPSVAPMSALWLVPQVCLAGLADAFAAIAQIEFFYSEFPKSMSCIASNLYGLGMGVASLVASLILSLVNHATRGNGRESWISSDVNKGHYDYYYWVLATLSFLNCIYFLLCSKAFGGEGTASENVEKTSNE